MPRQVGNKASDKPVKRKAVAKGASPDGRKPASKSEQPKVVAKKAVKKATETVKSTVRKVAASARKAVAPKAAAKVSKPRAAVTRPVARRTAAPRARKVPVSVSAVTALTTAEDQIAPQAPTDVRERYFREMHAGHVPAPQRELPLEYGDTKIVLLVRDPEWIFAYWEVNDATRQELRIPREGHSRRIVIRCLNITGRN